jgi:hypothetical protein
MSFRLFRAADYREKRADDKAAQGRAQGNRVKDKNPASSS